jgi:hypothetical protein
MPAIIEEREFSGFPGRDAHALRELTFAGRVAWLRYRYDLVFAAAFRTLLDADNHGPYVWLCAVNLLCTAIQALSGFEFNGPDQQRFISFVEEYFPDFVNPGLHLSDPRPRGADNAQTPAEHLYKFFRSGLAHSFCIEWGGIQHRDELPVPIEGYLFEVHPGAPGFGALGVVPRDFVLAFHAAVDQFFTAAAGWPDASPERLTFDRCFARVFLLKERPPIP